MVEPHDLRRPPRAPLAFSRPKERRIEVIDLHKPAAGCKTFSGTMPVRSHLLHEFVIPAAKFFE